MATIVPVKRKKGQGYQAVIRKAGVPPIKRTFNTKGEAKFWVQEQEGLIYAKKYKDPRLADKVSLGEALEKYATYSPVTRAKKASTLDREIYSRRHLERILGESTPLSSIETATVAAYQSFRLDEGGSASSIRQEMAMLSKMFRKARVDWGLPIDNPTEGLERVSPDPGRERYLTEDEAITVLIESQNSRNDRYYPFLLLLMHTGMRSGEAARIQQKHLDFAERTILIEQTKSGKPRKIPLTVRAATALKAMDPLQGGYLFLKPNHLASKQTMLRPGAVFRKCWENMWDRLIKKGTDNENFPDYPLIPYFKIHDIRHTAASHLLSAGIDVRIIADILGHSTLQMAMRYTHVFNKTKTETIDNLNDFGFKKE
jgi:integrase